MHPAPRTRTAPQRALTSRMPAHRTHVRLQEFSSLNPLKPSHHGNQGSIQGEATHDTTRRLSHTHTLSRLCRVVPLQQRAEEWGSSQCPAARTRALFSCMT
jgi:hypothetical protein